MTLDELKEVVGEVLQLGDRINSFDRETGLLGNIPEFDSMAVVAVITALEDDFGIELDDDEISAEIFETLGSLLDFVTEKAES